MEREHANSPKLKIFTDKNASFEIYSLQTWLIFMKKTASIDSDARKSDEEPQSNEKKFNSNFDFKVKVTIFL
jgi:hypothetical protein